MLPSELHESITICLDFGVNLIGLRIGELIIKNNNLNYISQDTRIPPYWSTKTLKTAAITHCSFFFFFSFVKTYQREFGPPPTSAVKALLTKK